MKVVFDTNVYVSEALVGGIAEGIVQACVRARFRIFVSTFLLDETERVLHEKLQFSARYASLVRQRVLRRGEAIQPPPSRHVVPEDSNDSPVLQAAISAGADFLVTGDRHLLSLHSYESIQIVSMRDFAERLINDGLLSR